jgi:transketolase
MNTANQESQKLITIARQLRKDVIISLASAGSGHLGASLGLADIFSVLYFSVLTHRPTDATWPHRDRLVLSIGHAAPVYYAAMANAGYFPREELLTLRQLGSRLQGHPSREDTVPGIESASGSLGQGLSIAVGMALTAKLDKQDWHVYSVHGDGELQEGAIWEAAMSAAHYKLNNLTAIVDRNGVQIDGPTSRVMELEPLSAKFEAFGWHVLECDGNDIEDLMTSFSKARAVTNKPTVIIATTHMGAGVPEIEDDYSWHGKAPNEEQKDAFLKALHNG